MKVDELKWKSDYDTGVEFIDVAHETLFSILRHILETFSENDSKNYKHMSQETLKYLKNYTIEHFSNEEAYMRAQKYSGFPMHQRLHNCLRDITIPAIEADLEENKYSYESVLRLVGVVTGWLTKHIMIEDRAITGKSKSRFPAAIPMDKLSFLDSLFCKMIRKNLIISPRLMYQHYSGEMINDPYIIELVYKDQYDKDYRTVVMAESQIVFYTVGKLLDTDKYIEKLGKDEVNAYMEFIDPFMRRALEIVYSSYRFTEKSRRKLFKEDFAESFDEYAPEYSPLWISKRGMMGFCIYP